MAKVEVFTEKGKVTAYWADDRKALDNPMANPMDFYEANRVGDGTGFAALLNKQFTVKPHKHNGVDGYLATLKK